MGQNVFYNALISLYSAAVKTAGFTGNQKAKQRYAGQKSALSALHRSKQLKKDKNTVWFHCASMGEYEQGRPIMELLKKESPEIFILVTYFSPSGFNHHKPDDIVDFYTYLPDDTPQNAVAFLQAVNPRLAVFIKYEFWKNYIDELHRSQIPLIYTSAIFRPSQPFFTFYGKSLLHSLKTVDYFFVQNRESVEVLNAHGINQAEVAGDVRFDRAVQTVKNAKKYPRLESAFLNSQVIIFGSAWLKEIEALEFLIKNPAMDNIKLIVAPHDISKNKINRIKQAVKRDYELFSDIQNQRTPKAKTLIVDTIGDLKHLYQFAQLAVIGGGFNEGIHNIIEPAAFGMPVFFGPKNKKFPEAADMQTLNTGFEFNNSAHLEEQITPFLNRETKLQEAMMRQKQYIQSRTGAAEKITDYISSKLE